MCTVDVYLDLLEQLAPMSLVFEADTVMPYEFTSAVKRSILQLREKEDEIGKEGEFLDSYVSRYHVTEDGVAKGQFTKAGRKKKRSKTENTSRMSFQWMALREISAWERYAASRRKLSLQLLQL